MKRIVSPVRASEGVAVGRAYVVRRSVAVSTAVCGDVKSERERFERALETSISQLSELAAGDGIFAAHVEIARDDMLRDGVLSHISDGMPAAEAVKCTGEEVAAMFADIDDEYLRARVDDVRDVVSRIGANLSGGVVNPFEGVRDGDVIVADTLAPSDMAMIDFSLVRGFVTEAGSATSHVCIIARNRGIPAVVGACGCTSAVADGETVAVDAANGEVLFALGEDDERVFRSKADAWSVERASDSAVKDLHPRDASGREIAVYANAGSVEEVRAAVAAGADGIGLFRSEFLYMSEAEEPSEERQYEVYAAAAGACGGRPLTIRTLDAGGDKMIPYMDFGHEDNPFMGWRAIRVSLSCQEMFKRQLRAILRAGAVGDVRVMFPMVTDMSELREAKSILEECKSELSSEGIAYDSDIRVGVMIETPAAVLIASDLAAECDFFSIGTNDLTQYVMAADRANARVSALCNPMTDAVRRAIRMTIEAADAAGIECGMCGEMASDAAAAGVLLEAGLREFSVNISSIGRIKRSLCALCRDSDRE